LFWLQGRLTESSKVNDYRLEEWGSILKRGSFFSCYRCVQAASRGYQHLYRKYVRAKSKQEAHRTNHFNLVQTLRMSGVFSTSLYVFVLWYGVVWCGVVYCGVPWWVVVWCGVV
jgi:hypothetical protein